MSALNGRGACNPRPVASIIVLLRTSVYRALPGHTHTENPVHLQAAPIAVGWQGRGAWAISKYAGHPKLQTGELSVYAPGNLWRDKGS